MEIKCRDEIVKNLEEAIKSADKAVAHLESLCRNVPNDFSIQEKRNYTNKIYDDIESFDRFKQNAIIILNEAKTLPQTEIISHITPAEVFFSSSKRTINSNYQNDFSYTCVDKIVFCGGEFHAKNWAETLIAVTEFVIKDKGITSSMLINSENLKGKKRYYFSSDATSLKRAYQLTNGCYVELNFSAKDIYKICHLIVNEFGYSESDLEIFFSKKAGYADADDLIKIENEDAIGIGEISEEAYDDPVKMLEELEKSL